MSAIRELKNQERKDQTRKALLEAAAQVFARQGYHKTLISDIVAEAGFGQGTFYRHFKDKREILSVLKDDFVMALLGEFKDMSLNLPMNRKEYRQASIDAMIRIAHDLNEKKDFVFCLLHEAPAVDKEFADEIAEIMERFSSIAKYYLDHAIEQGFARQCNADIVSKAVVGMGRYIISLWIEGKIPNENLEALVTEMVDFGFLGLGET